ncbi:MAG: hypothetical protein J5803_01665 [Desulfovibrio sp.]|nr:hypothetical protein [Desulfovibrio sp.]
MRILCSCLAFAFCLFVSPAFADDAANSSKSNPVDILTGELWQKTAPEEKRAFLFGVDSAVTVEYYVNDKLKEKGKKKGSRPLSTLSPFEKGWMKALKDMPRQELIRSIDDWYAANPDQIERPVMAVIWYEIISPRLPKDKK